MVLPGSAGAGHPSTQEEFRVRTRRTAPLVVALAAGAAVLSGCTYSAEPAPDQPETVEGFSEQGFPAPGPAPVPGQIIPSPAPPVAAANEPRPERGPVPTEGPRPSEPGRSTEAPAPPPGS